jgi:hypothetical protein
MLTFYFWIVFCMTFKLNSAKYKNAESLLLILFYL